MIRVVFILSLLLPLASYSAENKVKPCVNCKVEAKPTPMPIEGVGDTFFSLSSTLYTTTIETNNAFGVVKSNLNKSYDLDIAKRMSSWFKLHLNVGLHQVDYDVSFGKIKDSFFHYGTSVELTAFKNLSFDIGGKSGDQFVFREIENQAIGYKMNQTKFTANANLSLVRNIKWNVLISGGGAFIPFNANYSFGNAYGYQLKGYLSYAINENWVVSGSVYQENMTYVLDGTQQSGKEVGGTLGLTWQSR